MTLEELKRIADSATSGPWHKSGGDRVVQTSHITRDVWTIAQCPMRTENNAEFIATFNPTLIKAMLKEIETARAMRDSFEHYYVWEDLYSVPSVELRVDAYDKAKEALALTADAPADVSENSDEK
jgi:hypothetical protein